MAEPIYHVRQINGVIAPMPMKLKMARYTVDLDSYTAASGTLIRNPVAQKRKFFLTFPPCNKSTMQTILQMLDSEAFTVQYEDMFTGNVTTGTFYHGDIEVEVLMISDDLNQEILYAALPINLIEY